MKQSRPNSADSISLSTDIPYIDVANYHIDASIINLIPKYFAKQYLFLPLFRIKDTLFVGMVNPKDKVALDKIRKKVSLFVEPAVITKQAFNVAFSKYYN